MINRETACAITKLPADFATVGVIKSLFPSALVIDMRRDHRDSALSSMFADMLHHRAAMAHSFSNYIIFWRAYRACMEHWRRVLGHDPPSPILEVWYEDLVKSPGESLGGVRPRQDRQGPAVTACTRRPSNHAHT